ncbi:hypothetical protein DCS_01568 [Drechmeria coniospora]|uniref:Uncharacterized protein n=1 Tax=Drechmeria coniospora TaxID=98403 RepID=A0A151GTN2_DRECN|nr:hypothetical protein DCS_01568 [Drechmeria coniospora]KYK60431.1 hypothetical protein DCS_01568 [Drechmeria coniospora]
MPRAPLRYRPGSTASAGNGGGSPAVAAQRAAAAPTNGSESSSPIIVFVPTKQSRKGGARSQKMRRRPRESHMMSCIHLQLHAPTVTSRMARKLALPSVPPPPSEYMHLAFFTQCSNTGTGTCEQTHAGAATQGQAHVHMYEYLRAVGEYAHM